MGPSATASVSHVTDTVQFTTGERVIHEIHEVHGAACTMELWADHVKHHERTSFIQLLLTMTDSSSARLAGAGSPLLSPSFILTHPLSPGHHTVATTDESTISFAERAAALACAGIDTLAPRSSRREPEPMGEPPRAKRRVLQLAYNPEPSQQPPLQEGSAPPVPSSPPPREAAIASLAAIVACADVTDEASTAHTAKELFDMFVHTSEMLAEAHSKLRKYQDEDAERERVHLLPTNSYQFTTSYRPVATDP